MKVTSCYEVKHLYLFFKQIWRSLFFWLIVKLPKQDLVWVLPSVVLDEILERCLRKPALCNNVTSLPTCIYSISYCSSSSAKRKWKSYREFFARSLAWPGVINNRIGAKRVWLTVYDSLRLFATSRTWILVIEWGLPLYSTLVGALEHSLQWADRKSLVIDNRAVLGVKQSQACHGLLRLDSISVLATSTTLATTT